MKPSKELRRWKRWDTARPYQELSIAACGMILGCEWEGSWFQLGTERRAEIMSEAIEAAEALEGMTT